MWNVESTHDEPPEKHYDVGIVIATNSFTSTHFMKYLMATIVNLTPPFLGGIKPTISIPYYAKGHGDAIVVNSFGGM